MIGRLARAGRDTAGFTLFEVMVAALVLVVGMLGTVVLIDGANNTTLNTQAREQAVSLQRELLEAARSIPYSQLVPLGIVSRVQSLPGLANAGAGPGWTIQRRHFTYQVAVGVCSVDDPNNGYGTEDPNLFCAASATRPTPSCITLMGISGSIAGDPNVVPTQQGSSAGQKAIGACGLDPDLDGRVDDLTQTDVASCAGGACAPTPSGDTQPDNYKRIVTLVTWKVGTVGHYSLQASTVANPGQAGGPTVSSVTTTTATPITSSYAPTTVPITVSASSDANSVVWSLDGANQGNATASGGPWSFSWNIGTAGSGSEVLDGTYTVEVKAFNSNGIYGQPRSLILTLNRRAPYAPRGLAGGRNGSVVDFQWIGNNEHDIAGYRIYRVGTGGQGDTRVCDVPTGQYECQDTAPPSSSSLQYYAVAVDHDNGSPPALREGDHSASITVTSANQAPNPPTNLLASPSGGNTVLAWTAASVSDADGESVDFYRIYRDGQAYANRYDRTLGAQTTYTDTATGGVPHTYYVTAVDPQLAESTILGPVTR